MGEIIDWNKFKSEAKGGHLERAKQGYIDLCELLNKNNHTLLSEYVNAHTKVLIDFNCGHKSNWIPPYSYKKGVGCPRCVGTCSEQAKEDLLSMLKENGHMLLSEYVNNSIKVLIDFNCGHKPHWIRPNHYKQGQGCPKCSGMCTKQAKEDLINLINKNGHKLLSQYINAHTKVLIDFNCEHKPHWILPNSYKNGIGCPKCSAVCSEQAEIDLKNMLEVNGHKLLSEYVNAYTKVLIDFNCGHKPHWIVPNNYKNGRSCPKCSGTCVKQAKEDFLKLVKKNNHKLLSEYINAYTKVLIDFNCGHEPHEIAPSNYKNGIGCPKCIHKGEAELHKLLIDMGYEVETEKGFDNLKDKKRLRYDFYIPKYNLLIELDGDHHRDKIIYKTNDMTELEKYLEEIKANERLQDRQYKDKLKNDYAKDNNIPLLRIKYSNGMVELDKWKKLIEDKIKEINFH